jgi:biopolymer transport protein TolQ
MQIMGQSAIQSVVANGVTQGMPIGIPPGVSESLSLWGMFWGAEPIIKLVILVLLCASIWCWTIILQKVIRFRRLYAAADQFEESFWSGGSLDDLYDRIHNRPQDPLSSIFCAAMREWRRSISKGLASNETRGTVQQRIERVMQLTSHREMDYLERHLGFLASTGATAPFIGLFGTVLGIMNSFQSIAAQQNTNLAVVAPGIAEALFATAIGLIAAIPAVIAYNKLSNDLNRYANRLDAFSAEFSAIISRQFEEQA